MPSPSREPPVTPDAPPADPVGGRLLWYPGHERLLDDIVRAENCRVEDARGNRWVDLESGVWCTSIGHGHPRILRTISEQAARLAHTGFNWSSAVVEDAAREVLALLGLDGGRCVFLCSGSEAVEYGVRAIQSISGAPLLLTMADSYFGAYGSAALRREAEWHAFDWMQCRRAGVEGCREGCEHWSTIPFDRIGGFLFEPGSSSGLVRFPPRELIGSLARRMREGGGFVLVNEVTTGMGRTGEWFGFQHYDLAPDVVAAGKGLGNGYPVSVAAFAPRVVDRLGSRTPKYAQSHQNDPLGAAVAREVIRVIREERLLERARELSTFLHAGLERIRDRAPRLRDVRVRGLMIALELADDAGTPFTVRVHTELVRRGFLVGRRPGVPVLRLDPALTIDRADLAAFLAALEEVLTDDPPNAAPTTPARAAVRPKNA